MMSRIDGQVVLMQLSGWVQSITAQDWAWVGVAAHTLLTVFMVIRILSTQRHIGVAVAWLVLLFAIPFLGIIAYILVGEPFLGKQYKARSTQAKQLIDSVAKRDKLHLSQVDKHLPSRYLGVSRIGTHDTGFGVYPNHQMQLLTSSDAVFDAIIADINQATRLVVMEFYIVFPKGRVTQIFEALLQAAKRGVECQILADSVGSFIFFTDDWYERLTDAGVMIHRSLPVGLFKTLFKRSDLRNHRKIVVIDDRVGYTGSFNLVDPLFFKQDKAVGQWIDVMMRIESDEPVSIVTALAIVSAIDIGAENRNNLDALSERIDQHINAYTRKLYVPQPHIDELDTKVTMGSDRLWTHRANRVTNFVRQKAQALKDSKTAKSSQLQSKQNHSLNQNSTQLGKQSLAERLLNFANKAELTDKLSSMSPLGNKALAKHADSSQSEKKQHKAVDDKITSPKHIQPTVDPNSDVNENHLTQVNRLTIPNFVKVDGVLAQLIPSAPRLTGHVIYNTLLSVLYRANDSIQITTPYFVPDEALLSALMTAARRGVDVTLIVPKKVDSFLVQHASQASYEMLLEAGVKIALFKGGLLHAKTVVIDDDYCLFGTVNMDMRSFYLNMEISLALYTPDIVRQVLICQQAYLTQCEWVSLEEWQQRASYHKLFDSGIRLFSPLL